MHDDFYQMYLEELKEITPCTREEQESLLLGVVKGDKGAKERLAEGSLKRALEAARQYDGQGVLLTDLVQEANMALLTAIETYGAALHGAGVDSEADKGEDRGIGLGPSGFDRYLDQTFTEFLNRAVEEQKEAGLTGEELAARVNVLQEIAGGMAKELGREATVEELAKKMKMSEDEIRGIMKMAMNAISMNAENMDMEALAGAEGMELVETMEDDGEEEDEV